MAKRGPAAERLRAFVRERVSKAGKHYAWGNGTHLAKALAVDQGWVTGYVDNPPTRHADLDQVITICRFYGLAVADLSKTKLTPAPTLPPLVRAVADIVADDRLTVELDLLEGLVAQIQARQSASRPTPSRRRVGTR